MTATPDDSWAFHPMSIPTSTSADLGDIASQIYSPGSSGLVPDLSGNYITVTTTPAASHYEASFNAAGASSTNQEGGNESETTMNMNNQLQTYPLLFNAISETPSVQHLHQRWWEGDAETVLWSFDVRQISLVIRFGFFHDNNQPRQILLRRSYSVLDTFLTSLLPPYESQFIPGLTQNQKVEEILRRCQPTTISMNLQWSWYPSQVLRGPGPAAIAEEIEVESQMHFKAVPFEAWVRCSLGFPAAEADWFFLQHNALYIILLNHLQAYRYEIPKYREVEKLLRQKSPFAHKAVVQCLSHFPDAKGETPKLSNKSSLDFIAGPIQDLFQKYPANLVSILKKLSVIAIRFRQTYIHVPKVDWNKRLDTRAKYLDELLKALSPTDLARSLTRADNQLFGQLSREALTDDQNTIPDMLHARWGDLVMAVRECCTAMPDFVQFIQECIQILHNMRNYNSTLALIQGLQHISINFLWVNPTTTTTSTTTTTTTTTTQPEIQTVNIYSLTPPNVSYIADPSNNYASYRHAMKVTPGIPFLLPHIVEYRQHGVTALDELFGTT
ncbi:conserved hypothetical protein [Talaromyces stipitatus ATCC 10500]|uniref:Ras-GEF domain-containing protein n=1 Tax=Talaromyces stipitatus (strain ATCC 10500 / CBS 375.48 / QM 6759 / NRRL 1006) TaxID=441959 RepID=B8MMR9_TALSN|nr:uncharacterized protein TSTA_100690 [Talaromyces stipitatus ATCC 10500]EED13825.1 conserved hypothetical protein [Talaromyces stipitatus ATCC 10500]